MSDTDNDSDYRDNDESNDSIISNDGSEEDHYEDLEQEEVHRSETEEEDSEDDIGHGDSCIPCQSALGPSISRKVYSSSNLKLSNDAVDATAANSFLNNSENWELKDTLCLRCEDKTFFNIIFTLNEGRDKDSVQLAVCVQKCPESSSVSFHHVRLGYCRVKILLMSKFEDVVGPKFLYIDPDNRCNLLGHGSKDISSSFNTAFLPASTLRSLCQVEKRADSDTSEVEFVSIQASAEVMFSRPSCQTNKSTTQPQNNSTLFSYMALKRRAVSKADDDFFWIKKLRKDSSFTDVTFKVGPDLTERFEAHKCILAARSPVFAAMFQSNMKETQSGEIELEDVTVAAMQAFLHSIYETNMEILGGSVGKNLDVLALAHKYQINDIVEGCTENIVNIPLDEMSVRAAFDIFSAGFKLGISDLEFKALQCIRANKKELNTSSGRTVLQDFFESDPDVSASLFIGCLL